jgi:glycosyltransferase involved in cell wall biosynthesis
MRNQTTTNIKRLLFVIDGLGVGGAERQTIDLLNSLDLDKFEIGLVYLYPKEDLLPRLNISRLKVFEYLHRRGKFDPGMLKRLAQIIQAGRFETVICINEYPLLNTYFCKILKRLDISLITVLHHTTLQPGFWEWLKNKLYQKILNKCNKVVFVSNNQKKYWVDKYNINKLISICIHNGIDETSFADTFSDDEKRYILKKFGFKKEDFICGICARLDPHKKHEDFIEAVHLASKRIPHIKGLIIGDGPQISYLQKLVSDYTLESVVKFAGYQEEVAPYISICDCMIITSHYVETFSIAALESMAMNKPMIMTNIGGASEQITDGVTGFLYSPGNTIKLSELMVSMSDHSFCQKMGADASRQVRTHFTLDKMINDYEHLFLKETRDSPNNILLCD